MSALLYLITLGVILLIVLALGAPGVFLLLFFGLLAFGFLVGRKLRKWWREFNYGEEDDDFSHLDQDKGSH